MTGQRPKVLHINTVDQGGAANAMLHQHYALLGAGFESKVLCLNKTRNLEGVHEFNTPKEGLAYKILKKLRIVTNHRDRNYRQLLKYGSTTLSVSFPNTDYDLLGHSLVKEADIINLHWVGNFVDYSFLKNIEKPVVWTIHDMNPFKGIFHYDFDQISNTKLVSIENKVKLLKGQYLAEAKNLTIVGPSKWITNLSLKSENLGRFKHYAIPNAVDIKIFKSLDSNHCRKALGLPTDKRIILFVAQSLETERKGFKVLLKTIKEIEVEETLFAVVGDGTIPLELAEEKIFRLGYISDSRLMAQAYNAADLFVIPSLEDNLPNTVLESLCCGTPVVGFKVGGIQEMVESGLNGLLADEVNPQSFLHGMETGLKITFSRQKIEKDAHEKYNYMRNSHDYMNLYSSIIDL